MLRIEADGYEPITWREDNPFPRIPWTKVRLIWAENSEHLMISRMFKNIPITDWVYPDTALSVTTTWVGNTAQFIFIALQRKYKSRNKI